MFFAVEFNNHILQLVHRHIWRSETTIIEWNENTQNDFFFISSSFEILSYSPLRKTIFKFVTFHKKDTEEKNV